jgi:hypothetical protein
LPLSLVFVIVIVILQAKYPKLETHTYQDVVHATPKLDDPNSGDIFFFGEPKDQMPHTICHQQQFLIVKHSFRHHSPLCVS